MSRRVWIVRHGARIDHGNSNWAETAENPMDPPLKEPGFTNAEETARFLVKELKGKEPLVVSSPYLRCIQTVAPLSNVTGWKIRLEAMVGERVFHPEDVARTLSVDELRKKFPNIIDDNQLPLKALPQYETENDFFKRAYAIRELIEGLFPEPSEDSSKKTDDVDTDRNVIVCTHAAVMYALLLVFLGRSPTWDNSKVNEGVADENKIEIKKVGYCAVTMLSKGVDDDDWSLRLNSSQEHLDTHPGNSCWPSSYSDCSHWLKY